MNSVAIVGLCKMIHLFKRRSRTERVITRARKMIERQGWTQGLPGVFKPGGTCAAYAITRASHKLGVDDDLALALFADRNELPTVATYGAMTPTQRVVNWNDTAGRYQMEVIRAFRKAEGVA